MIGLGSFNCNTISLGNLPVKKVWLGNMQVWAADHYIALSSTGTNVSYSQYTSTVSLTADTSSWTVARDVSWITYSKVSSMAVSYTVAANSSTSSRVGHLYFKIEGTTYATFTITQSGVQSISGVTTYVTYGDWVLGYVTTGTYTSTNVPIRGIVLAYPDEISDEVVATISMTYHTGPYTQGGSTNSVTITSKEYTISGGQTFTASIDGTQYTFNGRWIVTPTPGTTIDSLTELTM